MVSEVQVLEAAGKPGLMLFILRQQPAQTLSTPGSVCVARSSALFLVVTAELLAFRLCPARAGWRAPGAECQCH